MSSESKSSKRTRAKSFDELNRFNRTVFGSLVADFLNSIADKAESAVRERENERPARSERPAKPSYRSAADFAPRSPGLPTSDRLPNRSTYRLANRSTVSQPEAAPVLDATLSRREPAVEIHREPAKNLLVLIADFAGEPVENIQVEIHGDILILALGGGDAPYEKEYLLPDCIHGDPVYNSYQNGVLELHLEIADQA